MGCAPASINIAQTQVLAALPSSLGWRDRWIDGWMDASCREERWTILLPGWRVAVIELITLFSTLLPLQSWLAAPSAALHLQSPHHGVWGITPVPQRFGCPLSAVWCFLGQLFPGHFRPA